MLTAEFSSAGGALLLCRMSERELVVPTFYSIVFLPRKSRKARKALGCIFCFSLIDFSHIVEMILYRFSFPNVALILLAARVVTLRSLFTPAVGFIGFMTALTVNHFAEGIGGVNRFLVRDKWSVAIDRWLNDNPKPSICVRTRSKSGAQREHAQRMLASTLLKRGTFRVLFLKYVNYRQWTFLSLARDAYTASLRRARHCQDLFFQYHSEEENQHYVQLKKTEPGISKRPFGGSTGKPLMRFCVKRFLVSTEEHVLFMF